MNNRTIVDMLKHWAEVTPGKEAYAFLKNNKKTSYITFKQVYYGACRYAAYLQKKKVKKGDRIIVFAQQSEEVIYAIYGILMMGGIFILIPAPVDEGKRQRFMYTLESSEAKYILNNGYDIDDKIKVPIIEIADIIDEVEYIDEDVNPEDIACLQYTSGSISQPKGIVWTHKNIMASMKILSQYTFQEDIFVTWLPFFHSMGLCTGVLLNMYVNSTNIIIETQRFMNNPIEWLEKISQNKSTMIWAPNSAYLACVSLLVNHKDISLDLSSVKYMISCSESIQPSDWAKIASEFGKYGLKESSLYSVYGLSEATGEVSGGRVYNIEVDTDKLKKRKVEAASYNSKGRKVLSSVGAIVNDLNIRIVNPNTLMKSNSNEFGEIWVHGDSIACGYWNNAKATEETFYVRLDGEEGTFLRTGDLGVIIDKQLYIMGRIKEILIVNGHNVFPRDIEVNIKKEIHQLKNKIVYAFSVTIGNDERVIIAIEGNVKKDQYEEISGEIKKVVYKHFDIEPYDVLILGENALLRTDNGKIALTKNRQAYLNNSLDIIYSIRDKSKVNKEKKNTGFTKIGLEIKKIFEEILESKCTSMQDDFFELGGSSLKTIVLEKQLSKVYDIKVTSEDIINYSSVEKIEKLIKIKKGYIVNPVVDPNNIEKAKANKEDQVEKYKRFRKVDEQIKSNIRIRNIEFYQPKHKKYIEDVIQEFKEAGQDIEVLVKEQFGKEVLYLSDDENENSLTMAIEVVNKVLKSSGLEAKDMDMIIVSSTVPEYTCPPMSLLIHQMIGGREDAFCYDINVNCLGMTFAMSEVYRRIESDSRINRVLLVGTEFSAMHMREDDAQMRANMSDAACAVIFERTDRKCGLLDSRSHISIKDISGFAFPACGFSKIYKSEKKDIHARMGTADMNMDEIVDKIKTILSENNLKVEDISMFCFSQFVYFLTKFLRRKLNIPEDKSLYVGNKYGYTGTCSPFSALYEGIKQGKVKRGDYILLWTVAAGGHHVFTLIKY